MKGVSSSSSPTAEVRHSFLRFPIGPQEELLQILRARPLIPGHCIDWATVEQVQLAGAIWALLTTDPLELFFGIIELTYLELMMELCSTFHLQTVMTNYNDPGTVQFHLGRLVYQLSVPEFGMVVQHGRVHPHAQGTRAWTKSQTHPNSKFASHTGKNWGTRPCSLAVCPKIYR
ncbi:hypothetical protein GOBAR_AA17037 [Gossypium barbadense]|uniref:Uncharacterized protein n=1 Tax=Gossypium barbadense TaxID=3634 RepID=A0A2P5XJV8_GOSBA|nr:hypothetical protein GOBAR_AA17037 [Gossypium barbadense]